MRQKQPAARSIPFLQVLGVSLLLGAGCMGGQMDKQRHGAQPHAVAAVVPQAEFAVARSATIEVHGPPNGTPILVDGVFAGFVGKAPLEVTPGEHEIEAVHPCARRTVTVVSALSERTTHVEVSFARPYATVEFVVRSSEGEELEATVVRSGQYLGRSAEPHELPTCDAADELLRTTDFEIEVSGYHSEDVTAVLEPGASRRVEVVLKAREATSSNAPAQLAVAEARCASGSGNDCFNAGYLHASGNVGGPDGVQAARLFLAACQKGLLAGCYNSARAALRLRLGLRPRFWLARGEAPSERSEP